ncbi:MAG: glutamine amidotransferase-related protein, partial [Bryobacteraceae bacterium]
LGCQFHPEFKSKPLEPHPLFNSFLGAALRHREQRHAQRNEGALRPELSHAQ